jgi:hypothetical protein
MFCSGYIPKWIGVLLMIGGLGFVLRTFVLVLFPKYVSDYYMMPMVLTILVMGVWFSFKGVKETGS